MRRLYIRTGREAGNGEKKRPEGLWRVEKMTDFIIAGGGPAGLSAAIYALRSGHTATIIERIAAGGQAATAAEIENYPGLGKTSGWELAAAMEKHARDAGAGIIYDEITDFELEGGVKRVIAKGGSYESRALIIALGAARRLLGVPGEAELTGRGVSYCATCDGAFFRGKTVAVVGGGNSAVGDAIYLSNICSDVCLIHRRDEFRAEKYLQQQLMAIKNIHIMYDTVVTKINGGQRVESIETRDVKSGETKNVEVSGVFAAVGMVPQTQLLKDKLKLDEAGYIPAGEDCRTAIRGVYAAGDIRTKALRQIITAAADGASAANSALELF
jgi:thioredoxin reductase (NADPH)